VPVTVLYVRRYLVCYLVRSDGEPARRHGSPRHSDGRSIFIPALTSTRGLHAQARAWCFHRRRMLRLASLLHAGCQDQQGNTVANIHRRKCICNHLLDKYLRPGTVINSNLLNKVSYSTVTLSSDAKKPTVPLKSSAPLAFDILVRSSFS
jgi:hypothetical protein